MLKLVTESFLNENFSTMNNKTNSSPETVPSLKNILKLIGFKEIATNVYTIPPAKKINAYKHKVV